MGELGRRVLTGAAIGAVAGIVIGLVLFWIFGGSLLTYELVAVGIGLVLGVLYGAFYGGAAALPRSDRGPRR